jgi:hypothetical protein
MVLMFVVVCRMCFELVVDLLTTVHTPPQLVEAYTSGIHVIETYRHVSGAAVQLQLPFYQRVLQRAQQARPLV